MSKLTEQLYGRPALKRTGWASAILILLVLFDGLFEFFDGVRQRGLLLLGLAVCLTAVIGLGWLVSPLRRDRE